MGFISKNSDVLKIDASIESKILNSKKIKTPIQLGDLKDFFSEETFTDERQRATRGDYRKQMKSFIKNEAIAKKLKDGTITLKELNDNFNEITTFGDLKTIKIFGMKDKNEGKNNSAYLYIIPIK